MTRNVAIVWTAALVLSLALAAALPAASASGSGTAVRPAKAIPITLYGSASAGWGFGPSNMTLPGPNITVTQGDVITFSLFAADSTSHNLVIDLNSNRVQDSNEPHSDAFVSSTTPVTYTYIANVTGSFLYICGFHGGGLMRGSFTVNPSTAPADNTLLIIGGAVVVVVVVVAAAAAMRMRRKKPGQPGP